MNVSVCYSYFVDSNFTLVTDDARMRKAVPLNYGVQDNLAKRQ